MIKVKIGNLPEYKEVRLVTKEWAEKRQKEEIPLWEGYIFTMPTSDYEYNVVSLENKYRRGDFFEQFMYKNEKKYSK